MPDGPRWWDSIATMRRIARVSTVTAALGLLAGMATGAYNILVAAPAFFVGACGVLFALFAWFRAEHLTEIARTKPTREA